MNEAARSETLEARPWRRRRRGGVIGPVTDTGGTIGERPRCRDGGRSGRQRALPLEAEAVSSLL